MFTLDEVARLLQVSVKTVRRAIDRGELIAVHVGGLAARTKRWRVRGEDLDAWLETRLSTPRPGAGVSRVAMPKRAPARHSNEGGGGRLKVTPEMGRADGLG